MSIALLIGNALALASMGSQIAAPPSPSPYREGQPDVRTARPEAQVDRLAQFRARYRDARFPTMLVMWNRILTDDVQSEYVDRTISNDREKELSVRGFLDNAEIGYSERTGRSERTSGRSRVREMGTTAAILDAEQDNAAKLGFINQLQRNDVQLVDRNLAMRTSPLARAQSGDSNVQEIEAEALTAHADILIEISQMAAPETPLGVKFVISAKSVSTAALLVSFVTSGQPPAQPARLVPGPTGFEREKPKSAGSDEVGAEIARQVMERLAGKL